MTPVTGSLFIWRCGWEGISAVRVKWEALANAEQGWHSGLFKFHVIIISYFVLFQTGFSYSRLASNPYGIMGMQQQWIWCWGSIQVCVHAWQALYQVSYTHTYTPIALYIVYDNIIYIMFCGVGDWIQDVLGNAGQVLYH